MVLSVAMGSIFSSKGLGTPVGSERPLLVPGGLCIICLPEGITFLLQYVSLSEHPSLLLMHL